jgi:hypothetical protein
MRAGRVTVAALATTAFVQAGTTLTAVAGPGPGPARGVTFAGLVRGVPGSFCGSAFELAVDGIDAPLCTHGPDPMPQGAPDTAADTSSSPAPGDGSGSASSTPGLCYDDGESGNRIQLVYTHGPDVADDLSGSRSAIVSVASTIDGIMNASAAEVGQVRHFRFVTDQSCQPTVLDVAMSADGRDNFAHMVNEFAQAGLKRSDRKYLILADANSYCGISTIAIDDRPSQYNPNDGVGYARVDRACWNIGPRSVPAHEVMHTLGSVQSSAPHASDQNHCNDHYDIMCSSTVTQPCPQQELQRYDCGKDDYFNPAPVAAGSYLSNHWNTAYSLFLETRDGSSTYPGPALSPPPSPVPPAPRKHMNGSGFASSLIASGYDIVTGDGPFSAVVTSTTPAGLSVTLQDANGHVISTQHATGRATVSGIVLGGKQHLSVASDTIAHYSLDADYPGP